MIILIALAIYLVIWRFWPNSFSNTISVNKNSIDSVSVHAMVNHFGIGEDTIDTYLIGENEQQITTLEDIIEFSELGDFIYSPVKTYSSGMYSKLDLKFDSPLILLPLFASLALSVIVLLFGLILYVYKYKRNTSSTPFYKAVSGAIDEKLRDKNK